MGWEDGHLLSVRGKQLAHISQVGIDDKVLTEKIADIYQDSRRTYGYRRITAVLIDCRGEQVGRHRVARLMREAQLQGVTRRKFCRTTRRDDRARPPPDLLERDFTATAPDQRWVADITYVPTWAGFLFLATVLDVFTRQVVGWSMSSNQNTGLVTNALKMAVRRRRPTGVVVHHSDQGCQYLSIRFTERLAEAEIVNSVGSKGGSYDNALPESFNGLYKTELIHRRGPLAQRRARRMGHADLRRLVQQPPHPQRDRQGPSGGTRRALLPSECRMRSSAFTDN